MQKLKRNYFSNLWSWNTRQPAYPGVLSALLNIFRMRNRETGLKVITVTGEPGARNATSVTRVWHLLENDQGTSSRLVSSRRTLVVTDFYYVSYVRLRTTSRPRLNPHLAEASSSGVRLTPRAQPIYSSRNQRASLAARADHFCIFGYLFYFVSRLGATQTNSRDLISVCILSSI